MATANATYNPYVDSVNLYFDCLERSPYTAQKVMERIARKTVEKIVAPFCCDYTDQSEGRTYRLPSSAKLLLLNNDTVEFVATKLGEDAKRMLKEHRAAGKTGHPRLKATFLNTSVKRLLRPLFPSDVNPGKPYDPSDRRGRKKSNSHSESDAAPGDFLIGLEISDGQVQQDMASFHDRAWIVSVASEAGLEPEELDMFMAVYADGISISKYARTHGINVNTCKGQCRRIKERFRAVAEGYLSEH